MEKIKISVIGVGSMGKNHLRICSEIPEFDLLGFWDPNPDTNKYATKYGIQSFDSLDQLINASDAVSIAAPSSMHKQLALQVAAAGKHALVEKPLGMDSEEAEVIVKTFDKKQLTLMVGHVERFNPVILELPKILNAETIIAIEARRCSPWNGRIIDADVVQDLMIHDMDIVINAINPRPIRSVAASGRKVYSEMIDFAMSTLVFSDGVIASITASRITEDKIRDITIHCKHALIRGDLLNRTLTVTRQTQYNQTADDSPSYKQENITERVFLSQEEPLKREFSMFARSIITKMIPPVTGEEAKKAIFATEQVRMACHSK